MTRRQVGRMIAVTITGIAMLLIGALYWLFYYNRFPRDGHFTLDPAAIRAAAGSPGNGPAKIEIEQLSHTFVPRIGVVAGSSWGKVDMVRASYRLVWPTRSAVIDTGYSLEAARRHGAVRYDEAAWSRIQQALLRADAIAITHEHDDHAGGLIESPNLPALLPHLRLTGEQIAPDAPTGPFPWPAWLRTRYRPLAYQSLFALAPGVVLIKAPGHTPGSQMIYVRLASGREYLFVGDVASLAEIVERQHIRPHYTTDIIGSDDRRAVMLQVAAIHALLKTDPTIILVPGHDGEAFEALIRQHALVRYFHL